MLVSDSFDIYSAQSLEAVLKGFDWSFKEFPTDASSVSINSLRDCNNHVDV